MRRSSRVVIALAMMAGLLPVAASASAPGERPRDVLTDRQELQSLGERRPRAPSTEPRAESGYILGEIVVTYARGVSPVARAAARARVPSLDVRATGRFDVFTVAPGNEAAAIEALNADLNVIGAEQNRTFTIAATEPDDPLFPYQWGLKNTNQFTFGAGTIGRDIDAPKAWDTSTGDGSVIAIVDTGVDVTHPDLVDRIDMTHAWDFFADDADPADENGHGTHVAGIAAASGDNLLGVTGVAWNATIMPLRVLGADGSGSMDAVADAFNHAAENGAHIVSASLGADGPEPIVLREAIADHPDTLYVVAAGNGGDDGVGDNVETTPEWPCNINLPNLICVAASDEFDLRTDFSNWGKASVDLAAPGIDIWSTMMHGAAAALGTYAVTDSPNAPYENDVDWWLDLVDPVDLNHRSGCHVVFDLMLDTELDSDGILVYASVAGDFIEDALAGYSGSTGGGFVSFTADPEEGEEQAPSLVDFEGASAFLSFRFVSDETGQYDGAYLDNIAVDCAVGGDALASQTFESGTLDGWAPFPPASPWDVTDGLYMPLMGTSMATPMVSGSAALLWSERPPGIADSVWIKHIVNIIRGGVEATRPWMANRLRWGGRLNVANSIGMVGDLSPPNKPKIADVDVGKTWQRTLKFDVRSTTTTDVGPAGVRSYDVRSRSTTYKGGFSAWSILFKDQRTGTFTGKTGRTYCFASRATDNAFNVSGFSAQRCTSIPVNDRQLTASSGWTRIKPSGSFRGTAMRSTTKGATLSLNDVKAKRLALVVSRCGTCGRVAVFRGGKRLAVLDLSGSAKKNVILKVKTFSSVKSAAKIRIRVLSSGKKVIIEGLAVGRV